MEDSLVIVRQYICVGVLQPQSLCTFRNPSLEGTRSAVNLGNDKNYNCICLKSYLPKHKQSAFDLEFPEISPAIFKTLTFPLEYVLKYACGLH